MPLHINMYAKCTCSEWNFESDESDVNVCIFVNVLVHNLDSVSIQTHTIFCGWSFYVQIFILVKSLSKQLPLHFFMWKKLYSTSTDLSLCMTWDGVLYFFFWCDWRWWAWTEKKVATALLSFKKKKKIMQNCQEGRKELCDHWPTHRSMLMAHRLKMLAVHIITSRVTKMSQWILLKRHSLTTCKKKHQVEA